MSDDSLYSPREQEAGARVFAETPDQVSGYRVIGSWYAGLIGPSLEARGVLPDGWARTLLGDVTVYALVTVPWSGERVAIDERWCPSSWVRPSYGPAPAPALSQPGQRDELEVSVAARDALRQSIAELPQSIGNGLGWIVGKGLELGLRGVGAAAPAVLEPLARFVLTPGGALVTAGVVYYLTRGRR